MQLIANFPMIAVYGYHAYNHYENDSSMYIHRPDPKLSTAENFLRMLRPNKQYTQLEAQVLDVALMLHMEHGGGITVRLPPVWLLLPVRIHILPSLRQCLP